jgi:outer membrane autotransporter protein
LGSIRLPPPKKLYSLLKTMYGCNISRRNETRILPFDLTNTAKIFVISSNSFFLTSTAVNAACLATTISSTQTLTTSSSCSSTPYYLNTGANVTINAGVTISNNSGGTRNGDTFRVTSGQTGINLTNYGTITTPTQWGISIDGGAIVNSITNFGTISSGTRRAIVLNGGSLTTLTNVGAISGPFGPVTGSADTLNNLQGKATATPLSVTALPTNYNIIIRSASNYGQLNSGGGLTSFNFNIYGNTGTSLVSGVSASTIQVGTYSSVLQNISSISGITGASGIYGAFAYSLVANGITANAWDLVVSNASTDMTAAGSPYLASNLGVTVNPAFAGGTLQMNQANTTYSQNFTVSNAITNTIDQDGSTSTFSGVFSNTTTNGNLVVTNSGLGGKVIFTGANTYDGSTTISNGATVAINGSMLSNMIVDAAGVLQGNGSFGGGTVSGVLAPGNSIGTITSNGNLNFTSGSTYVVEVDAGGNSDKTVVNGAANIQGGTVAVSGSLPSTPLALSKTKYTILTATNGVSGRFANVTGLPAFSFLSAGLSYASNDVTLGYVFATPFSVVGKNINQRNVGNALTVAALGPVSALGAPILNALFLGNYENAQSVMETVSGSGLAGVQSTAMQVGETASSAVSDQIAFWRSGETVDPTGRTSQEGRDPRSYMAYAPTDQKIVGRGPINIKGPVAGLTTAVAPRTFRAWGSMFGGGANYLSDAGRGAAASNVGFYGGLMGVDYQIQPNLLVGVAVGGSNANFNVGSLSTNGNLTGFHAGVYGAYTMGNSYIALNETFSAYNNQTTRKAGGYALMPYEQLGAQFGSTEFRTRAEAGHGVMMGGLKATPFVAAEIAAYQSSAFTENSSTYVSTFALKNNGQAINSLPTFAGLRLSNAVMLANGWRLAPVGSVAYVHEFFPQRQLTNMLISMPGTDFNVSGPRSTYNLVQTKIGAQLNLNEKLALFTDFQGEFSPVSQSYAGKGGLKYAW